MEAASYPEPVTSRMASTEVWTEKIGKYLFFWLPGALYSPMQSFQQIIES